jgi:hypothetical protein
MIIHILQEILIALMFISWAAQQTL